jgi:hypothetical protein
MSGAVTIASSACGANKQTIEESVADLFCSTLLNLPQLNAFLFSNVLRNEKEELEKFRQERPKIQQQFSDLKVRFPFSLSSQSSLVDLTFSLPSSLSAKPRRHERVRVGESARRGGYWQKNEARKAAGAIYCFA